MSQILSDLADACDAGLLVRREAARLIAKRITIDAERVPWVEAAQLLCDGYGLDLALEGDRLVVSDARLARKRRLVQRTYDVRAILAERPGRPGPDLNLPEPGGTGCHLLPPIDRERLVADIPGLVAERLGEAIAADGLQIGQSGGMLQVTALPDLHERIPGILAELERQSARQVTGRLWPLAAEPAEAVLDAASCARLIQGLPAPALTLVMQDEQQNHAWAGIERRIVADADVVQQVYDPIVSVVVDGLVLDCHPLVTDAGVVATLRSSAATTVKMDQRVIADAAGKPLLAIDQPERTYARSRDTRVIPPGGGTVLRLGAAVYLLQLTVSEP
jgi:hypothetical protein